MLDIDFQSFAWLGRPLVATGLAVALAAAGWLFISERRRSRSRARGAAEAPRVGSRLGGGWLLALVVVLAVGALVRLSGLEAKGISHPEAYIPGLDLPAAISEPPPRQGLVETAVWHFHKENHPFGYYLAMWLWTQIFGASLLSIRAPEAILGTLSVYLVYRVGRSAYSAPIGVIAAALLALHGFHIFWSQAARGYAPGAFFGLLSTVLLLETTRGARPRPGLEAAYVLTTVAGTMTVEFYWPFLAAQMLWIALRHRDAPWPPPRTAVVQTFAVVLAAPMLSHGALHAASGFAPPPSLTFLSQYFSFGFLFQHGAYEGGGFELPLVASGGVLVLSLVLVGRGLCCTTADESPREVSEPPSRWPLVAAALGSAATMLGVAFVVDYRRGPLAVLSLLPFIVLLAPWAAGGLRPTLARFAPRFERVVARGGSTTALIALLAIGPTLALFAASYVVTLTAPRVFLQFVPYLVLLAASGAWPLRRRRTVAAALAVVLGLTFAWSAVALRRTPTSTRDYQGLARGLASAMQPGDLVFTPARHWAYTPIFFYLDHRRIVAMEYAEALRRSPRPRVWVIAIPPENPPNDEVARALSEYQIADRIDVRQAGATLYLPPP